MLGDVYYFLLPDRAPRRQDLQIPKPDPSLWMKLQVDVSAASSLALNVDGMKEH